MSLSKLHKILLAGNIPFVSCRLPHEYDIVTLIQQQNLPHEIHNIQDFNFNETGFIISPAATSLCCKTYFLRPDSIIFNDNIENAFLRRLSENRHFINLKKPKNAVPQTTPASEYYDNVHCAVSEIRTGALHKAVLSKVRVENLPAGFEPENFFVRLCKNYPAAMVYFLHTPDTGCWLGATPEPLLTFENGVFKTVSLAGTQNVAEKPLADYSWTAKEIDEQAIVTAFIEQTLQNAGVERYEKTDVANCRAGNLIHLKTEFQFSQTAFRQPVSRLLSALHPTPSVGGMPRLKALDFIKHSERHDRNYFSGFLGMINVNQKTDIFINLRCLQLINNQVILYSGAGITALSKAEHEWNETENKMKTLMNVLNI